MALADARPVALINTSDRKAAEPFYADVLGLRRKGDDGFAALFDLAGVTLRLTEVPTTIRSRTRCSAGRSRTWRRRSRRWRRRASR